MNHLILDMDETLISMDLLHEPIARPYLEEFLIFCFRNFNSVSIWTSANIDWFDIVNIRIFIPILKKYKFNFRFIWCFDKCTPLKKISNSTLNINTIYIKELKNVWKEYKDMNKFNTIIIDDNINSFMNNVDNAINIKSWNQIENDSELLKVMKLLQKLKFSFNILIASKEII